MDKNSFDSIVLDISPCTPGVQQIRSCLTLMAEAPTSVTLYFQSHITPHFVIREQIIAVSGIKWGNRLDLPWNGISERRQPPQPENAFRPGINGFGDDYTALIRDGDEAGALYREDG
jgi:hypothetical protein